MLALLAVLDKHVFISNHHLHLAFIHEVLVVRGQVFAVLVVHELGKGLPVPKHKGADRIVVEQLCFAMKDVLDVFSVRGEVVRLVRDRQLTLEGD